jgi:hypothetical protein
MTCRHSFPVSSALPPWCIALVLLSCSLWVRTLWLSIWTSAVRFEVSWVDSLLVLWPLTCSGSVPWFMSSVHCLPFCISSVTLAVTSLVTSTPRWLTCWATTHQSGKLMCWGKYALTARFGWHTLSEGWSLWMLCHPTDQALSWDMRAGREKGWKGRLNWCRVVTCGVLPSDCHWDKSMRGGENGVWKKSNERIETLSHQSTVSCSRWPLAVLKVSRGRINCWAMSMTEVSILESLDSRPCVYIQFVT